MLYLETDVHVFVSINRLFLASLSWTQDKPNLYEEQTLSGQLPVVLCRKDLQATVEYSTQLVFGNNE